jgi:predicted RNase H-like HicB family nuclease
VALWQSGPMVSRYTGAFEQVDDWWTGYVEGLPGCNIQELTLAEARESLKEAIRLIVNANRELARRQAKGSRSE